MARKRWREIVPMLIPALAGLALMGISIFDTRDDAFNVGRAPVFAAGCAFFFAGVAVAAQLLPERRWRSLVQASAGTLILAGFAVVAVAVMLAGPAPEGSAWEGRIVGALAVAATVGLTGLGLVGVYRSIRQLRKEPKAPDQQP
ncbi:MAG: hypothetical protein IT464_13000 [Planctomycetes bacterium]|nr:hypothetical protein [Planctomycetota bacterium]